MQLEGKVALITGGASGIGRATAKLFLREGARVSIADMDRSRGEQTREELSGEGEEVGFVHGDVSAEEDARRMVEKTVEQFGKLDVLFNNAGVELLASVEETPSSDLDRIIDVNLKGTFLVSKYAIPELREREGVILNCSSGAGLLGAPNIGGYSASKGGIVRLTETLAGECAPEVRVNSICPGYIDTPMHRRAEGSDESFEEEVIPREVPLQRLGEPEDVARAALFLVSPASAYLTGVHLPVDGGLTFIRTGD